MCAHAGNEAGSRGGHSDSEYLDQEMQKKKRKRERGRGLSDFEGGGVQTLPRILWCGHFIHSHGPEGRWSNLDLFVNI